MDNGVWKIRCLYYGYLEGTKGDFGGGLDADMVMQIPYIGFLLQDGRQNIVVDTGIADTFLDKLPIGDVPPVGGGHFVLNALKQANLTTEDIDAVIYTHLNNDHAGNADLFPNAKAYIQRAEYENLLHPLPEQQERLDYDLESIERLKKVKNIVWLDGDTRIEEGLDLYLIPGHTRGSQAIVVPTAKGKYVLVGDLPHLICAMFPRMDRIQLLDGSVVPIQPWPNPEDEFLFDTFAYDREAALKSYRKLKTLGERFEPEFYLTSHEPANVIKEFFG